MGRGVCAGMGVNTALGATDGRLGLNGVGDARIVRTGTCTIRRRPTGSYRTDAPSAWSTGAIATKVALSDAGTAGAILTRTRTLPRSISRLSPTDHTRSARRVSSGLTGA